MNISDALKSGQRFRRRGTPRYTGIASPSHCITLTAADLEADDWEIEPKTFTLTASDLLVICPHLTSGAIKLSDIEDYVETYLLKEKKQNGHE